MYLENYSLIMDFKIILMTVKTVFDYNATEGYQSHTDNRVR